MLVTIGTRSGKAASNVGPYGLFWQPALVCHTLILYMFLFIGQIKMLACLLECRAFFEKPSRDGIRVGLLVGAVE